MRVFVCSLAVALGCILSCHVATAESPESEDGFIKIFDGKTMEGWKLAEENTDAWHVEDGKLVCDGERCHAFYAGPLAPMKDFHFKAEVMTTPGSNAGIYFHTKYQPTGWPKFGYECQVNVSHGDPKKTSSLYAVENVSADDLAAAGIKDNQWYTQEIIVTGRRIQLIVNGKTMVDYTEPENKPAFDKNFERRLDEGTIALQAHDPKSVCYFRNLRVKPL
ncbi:hypothetical protein Mal15_39980 [Stieleria maiorica]|uniref:3-keto-alpha-glucoside-1,2-lyase/3-keto-2-hydroxy-glucal hydratase domain-containing protein n=1 Tax=Stieleria maiorica TaxID=2795974 RepID=A0A5B9MFC0_9BACT|nr:DUF1080 domain-containing protein [Stieleria maiorica]QEF99931.1 hypothetical protein Mal15_39980 [Stieleria maiorica]